MDLSFLSNPTLRLAVQRNLVSFPSQLPAFPKGADQQRRIIQLYFVRGWRIRAICDRHKMCKSTVQRLISEWKVRAVAAGYIQEIDSEGLEELVSEQEARDHHFWNSAPGATRDPDEDDRPAATPRLPAAALHHGLHSRLSA